MCLECVHVSPDFRSVGLWRNTFPYTSSSVRIKQDFSLAVIATKMNDFFGEMCMKISLTTRAVYVG